MRCGYESIWFLTNWLQAKAFFLYQFGKLINLLSNSQQESNPQPQEFAPQVCALQYWNCQQTEKRIKYIKITWDLHFWGLKTKSRILKEWSGKFFSIQSTNKNCLSLYCTFKKWFYSSHEFMAPPSLLSWLALYSLKKHLKKGLHL